MAFKLKFFLLTLIIQMSVLSSMAQISIKGRVLNELNEALPYATINIEGSKYSTLTDENGYFELTCPIETTKNGVILFRHLGYESKKFKVDEFKYQKNVILKTVETSIGEVVVFAGKKTNKKEIKFKYDINRPEYHYQKNIKTTYQLASFIVNKTYSSGYLKEIIFHVSKAASDKTPIRLNFYSIDNKCNCPDKELNTNNIIVNVKRGRNKVDLEPYKVYLDRNDFYVAFEWLSVAAKAKKKFDFSIGMIHYESDFRMLEKQGGLDWKKLQRGSKSRVWTKIKLLKD